MTERVTLLLIIACFFVAASLLIYGVDYQPGSDSGVGLPPAEEK